MKITGSEIQMSASHVSLQREEVRQSLRMWTGSQRPDFSGSRPPGIDQVTISDAARAAQAADASAPVADLDAADNDPRLQLLRAMLFLLTGEEARVFDASELQAPAAAADLPNAAPPPAAAGNSGYGVEYDYHATRSEVEEMTFSASGVVKTADGQEIRFELELAVSRSYYEESNLSLRLGDAARPRKDPLVVNFAGTAAQLAPQRFRFDLDADGKAENINLLAQGSAFLAIDRNGDQRINDGRELFGARSGDGFADLAALDGDGNGWIDESDAAFAQLRLWTPDAEGGGRLQSLKEADVGALNVARLATPFDLRSPSNETLGQIRSSGVYLRESGGAGSLQQIDLSV
ncbi:MAG: VCBS repeat-containing protein [Dokdonella sp.]|nr:MAG: VCBS repeat-containing protein [Dokdonella sp.]